MTVPASTASADADSTSSGKKPWLARWAPTLLLLGVTAISLSPIFVRLSDVGPIATGANRMILALPVYWAIWVWRRPEPSPSRHDLWLMALAGVLFAGDLTFWHWALHLTSVANATLLGNLAPVFVVAAAWFLFREGITRSAAVGLAFALLGAGLLMGQSLQLSGKNILGDASGVTAAGFYAGYLMIVSRLGRRMSGLTVMAVSTITACIALVVLALATEDQLWPATTRGWSIALGLTVIVQLIGQSLIAIAFAYVPAGLGGVTLFLQPALAAVLAWILFGEALTGIRLVGAFAIVAGLIIAHGSAQRSRKD